ncbi:MAG: hypothetical protein M3461_07835 [Pseudomonadota bacterium]|nr:hypothetical protein [Pseudomonadota bacterium]
MRKLSTIGIGIGAMALALSLAVVLPRPEASSDQRITAQVKKLIRQTVARELRRLAPSLTVGRAKGPAFFARLGPDGTFAGPSKGVTRADITVPLDDIGDFAGVYCFSSPTGIVGGSVIADSSLSGGGNAAQFGLGRIGADECPASTQYHVRFESPTGFFLQLYQ